MSAADNSAGEGARSPFEVPADGWRAVAKRVWAEIGRDNVGLVAAGIAFYAFAAIVPSLAAIVLSYGLIADAATVQRDLEALFATLPRDAAAIIGDQLVGVVTTSSGKQGLGLVVALGIALYGATKGASAIVTGLNVAYNEAETRGFVRLNLLHFAIVLGGVAMAMIAIAKTTLFGFLEALMPDAPGVVTIVIRVIGFGMLAALVVTAAACLYRFAPARKKPAWVWLSPGSLIATALWLAGTIGFGIYVTNWGNYGATYGSLSAVIVMLTWLWLSAFVFLLGAEINSELERQVDGEASTKDVAEPPVKVASFKEPNPQLPVATIAGLGLPPVALAAASGGAALLRRGRSSSGLALIAIATLIAWRQGAKNSGLNATKPRVDRSGIPKAIQGKRKPMADRDYDIKTLNSLIATTLDSVDGYTEAAKDIENQRYGSMFTARAKERRQVVGDLQAEVRRLGGNPEDDGTVLAGAHRVFLDLKAKVTGQDDQAIVNEVERGEDHIKAKFDDAIGDTNLSIETLAVIQKANGSVQEGHGQMRDLKHALES